MATNSIRFPLQNSIKKSLDDPNSRPALPGLDKGSIVGDDNFGKADRYDTGKSPDIALNNGNVVVEVHESQAVNTLWYRVGKVEGKKIAWGNDDKSVKYDDGVQPSVAITNNGLVVEVHKSQGAKYTLWHRVGRVKGDTIDWGNDNKSIEYDKGVQPSVAITNDGLVVEVHKSQSHDTLWYRGTGQVKDNTIDWDNDKSQNYSDGKVPKVACNGELAVEIHNEGSDKLLCSVLTLPAFRSNWTLLEGDNSYCYCACNSATDNKHRHTSNHTMNIKEGAPYFYAVLTKDDDSIDFPTGAVLTIQGSDGTHYDRDIQEENQLVIMSGSSVRCLIVKDPKPGDWKMTMTVPEGVGFHCECNTVPSKDVYDTITETLDNSLQKRSLGIGKSAGLWFGLTLLGILLFPEVQVGVAALWMAAAVGVGSYVVPGKSGNTPTVKLSIDEQKQVGTAVGNSLNQTSKKGRLSEAAKLAETISYDKSRKKEQEKPNILLTWNCQGANWNNIASSPWIKIQEWFKKGNSNEENGFPYKIHVALLQECGSPPPSISSFPDTIPPYEITQIGNGVTLEKYFWDVSTDRNPLYLYILFYKWDVNGNRVNLAIISPGGISNEQDLPGHYRPLIGIEQGTTYFYTIHGSSRGGGDSWALLRDVAQRHNNQNISWWVAGDYNRQPTDLTQDLTNNGINVTVCPPNNNTWKTNNPTRKLDYATRNESASEIIGEVSGVGYGFSDHFPVFYLLN